MTDGKEDYVGVKKIAQHLGIAKSFVYKLIAMKKVPYYKVGSRFLFKISEVDDTLGKNMRYA